MYSMTIKSSIREETDNFQCNAREIIRIDKIKNICQEIKSMINHPHFTL